MTTTRQIQTLPHKIAEKDGVFEVKESAHMSLIQFLYTIRELSDQRQKDIACCFNSTHMTVTPNDTRSEEELTSRYLQLDDERREARSKTPEGQKRHADHKAQVEKEQSTLDQTIQRLEILNFTSNQEILDRIDELRSNINILLDLDTTSVITTFASHNFHPWEGPYPQNKIMNHKEKFANFIIRRAITVIKNYDFYREVPSRIETRNKKYG